MKVILGLLCLAVFSLQAFAWPGGCEKSSVSSKQWTLSTKPLDLSHLTFPNNKLTTKPPQKVEFLRNVLRTSRDTEKVIDITQDEDCGQENRDNGRIVGGVEAQPHQFPWMVATEIDGFIFCGASLISPKWVLTAAHCSENAIYVNLYLGAHRVFSGSNEQGRLEICAENTITHPEFDFPNYDITLVEVPVSVTFSQTISPVCLPPLQDVGIEYEGQEMTAIGWGYKSLSSPFPEDALRMVDQLPVLTDDFCRSVYSADLGETFLCVDSVFNGNPGHGTCNGDSGGPLVRKNANDKWEQVGIVSFGSTNCEEGAPDGFTQVNQLLEWIADNQ